VIWTRFLEGHEYSKYVFNKLWNIWFIFSRTHSLIEGKDNYKIIPYHQQYGVVNTGKSVYKLLQYTLGFVKPQYKLLHYYLQQSKVWYVFPSYYLYYTSYCIIYREINP
jgi:hypothetical protein